jgi:hypothetical protein
MRRKPCTASKSLATEQRHLLSTLLELRSMAAEA